MKARNLTTAGGRTDIDGHMFLQGMMMMESQRFCACIFLILLCCVEPFAAGAAALKPRKYGLIEGNMPAKGGAMEQVLGRNLGQGRVLLEASIDEVNVQKETALKDEEDIEEPKSQRNDGVSNSFHLLQKALGLNYGQMQHTKVKAKLKEQEDEEIGNKVVGLNNTMTVERNLKKRQLDMKAEEKNLSISETHEVVEEEEENLLPAETKMGHKTELRLAVGKELSKSDAQEEIDGQEEESAPVKKKVANETELKATTNMEKTSEPDNEEEAVEEEEEESVSMMKKGLNETVLKEGKNLSKSEDQEAVEDDEAEVVPHVMKKKLRKETELKAANEMKLAKFEAQEALEDEDEGVIPLKKRVGKESTMTTADGKKLSESEALEVMDDEEVEAIPLKKLGKQTNLIAADKELSESEAQEAMDEEVKEAFPMEKNMGKETILSGSEVQEAMKEKEAISVTKKVGKETNLTAEEEKELSEAEAMEAMEEEKGKAFPMETKMGKETSLSGTEVQEAMKVQEAISVKKKVGKETNLTVAEENLELSEAEAMEAMEEEDAEVFPVEKKVGNKIEPKAAKEKGLSKFEAQEVVEEEEEESIFVKKENMGNKTRLKATEEKKFSKLDSQEAREDEGDEEDEEDEEDHLIFVKKKEGTVTRLKTEEEKVLLKSEAQSTKEESILAGKKLGNKAELKVVDEKEGSKTATQNLVEEEISTPVLKEVGKETDLKATEDKKWSKSEPQEAVEEDEEESITVTTKVEEETDLKAMKDKELVDSKGLQGQRQEYKWKSAGKAKQLIKSLEHADSVHKIDVKKMSPKVDGKNETANSDDLEMEKKKEASNKGDNKKSPEGTKINNSQAAEEADPALHLNSAKIDLLQEVQDLPANLQQTVGAVTTHLLPKIHQISGQSKDSFDNINKNLAGSFLPLIGEKYAPIIATIVSYLLLMIPFGVVLLLCERIRAILTLQKVLLFINIYLAVYFAILFALTLGLGAEPISFFYKNSTSGYIILQLLQAFGYIIYMLLQTTDVVYTCSTGTRLGKWSAAYQCLMATLVGLHYCITVFHRAMARKPPHTSWEYYGLYCLSFSVCCLLSRIQCSKREYIPLGSETTDKKK